MDSQLSLAAAALMINGHSPYADALQAYNMIVEAGRVRIPFSYDNTDYAAGTKQYFVSPIDGNIVKLVTVGQVLTAGAGALTIKPTGGSNITALSQTIADATAAGTVQVTRTAPAAGNVIAKDATIELTVDATPTAGALNGYIEIQLS